MHKTQEDYTHDAIATNVVAYTDGIYRLFEELPFGIADQLVDWIFTAEELFEDIDFECEQAFARYGV